MTLLDERTLLGLADISGRERRPARYGGGGMSIVLANLDAEDAAAVLALYDAVSTLLDELRLALHLPAGDGAAPARDAGTVGAMIEVSAPELADARGVLLRTAKDARWLAVVKGARSMGSRMRGAGDPMMERAREAVHDVRGGALAALVLTLDFVANGAGTVADTLRPFYLSRDHLKIMRNAIEDVDRPRRERDMMIRNHSVDLLVEKWTGATHRQAVDTFAHVDVSCTYHGPISRQCLEFSALDRVLYNMMNNAARFASDGAVELYIRRIGTDVRFVVVNTITASHGELLVREFGDAPEGLFAGGFSVGGAGVGLRICGEFVANAYGLSSPDEAVEQGYAGIRVIGDRFVSWFHWPTVG